MAVRRARIKAVASIPVRKKAEKVTKVATPKPTSGNETELNTSVSQQSPIVDKTTESCIPSPRDKSQNTEILPPLEQQDLINNIEKEIVPEPNVSNTIPPADLVKQETVLAENINFPIAEKEKSVFIDGITPLASVVSPRSVITVPNSPILSTECNFDPFVPLPSPTKNRPKLKPTPCIATRRNSFQGSASESEDEVKKFKKDETAAPVIQIVQTPQSIPVNLNINRRRNDSICSLPGDNSVPAILSLTPRQKVHRSRTGYLGEERRAAARRRALQKAPQNPLTMCDLIYYNPPSDNKKKKFSIEKVEDNKMVIPQQDIKPQTPVLNVNQMEDEKNPIPVPQVKLGPNGEIIIDEQSLVIETTDTVKSRTELSKLSVVYENGLGPSTGGMYRRTSRSREWSHTETLRFYKALNIVGTDFALMITYFPGRTRKDLKVKFKREEKHNMKLVNKALMYPLNFDVSELEQEIPEEINPKLQKKKEKPLVKDKPVVNRKSYRKSSVALRSIATDYKQTENESNIKNPMKPIIHKSPSVSDNRVQSLSSSEKTSARITPFPTNFEPGSLVLSVEKKPGQPGQTLQAYIPQVIDGKTEMIPINLDINMLKSIAREMNIDASGCDNDVAMR